MSQYSGQTPANFSQTPHFDMQSGYYQQPAGQYNVHSSTGQPVYVQPQRAGENHHASSPGIPVGHYQNMHYSTAGNYVSCYAAQPTASIQTQPMPYQPQQDPEAYRQSQVPVSQPRTSANGSHVASGYPSTPITASNADPSRIPCAWEGGHCNIGLDDFSASGVLRHLREWHFGNKDAATMRNYRLKCQWTSGCRSHEMNYESLGKHIAQVHLKSTEKVCQYCGGTFARNDALIRHQRERCDAAVRP